MLLWPLSLIFIFGMIIGSLLNVISLRLPNILDSHYKTNVKSLGIAALKGLSLPASHCPECQIPLRWPQLIPIISYLIQKGRCKNCLTKMPLQYLLLELTSGLLATWCWLHYSPEAALAIFVFFASLLVLTAIDLKHKVLPDEITLPLLWGGLLMNVSSTFTPLVDSVLGAAIGYLSLWFVYQIHFLFTQREGLGYGDFKLLAAIGGWLGWQPLPLVLLYSSLLAIFYFGCLLLMKKINRATPIAFGPFLAFGTWLSLSLPLTSIQL